MLNPTDTPIIPVNGSNDDPIDAVVITALSVINDGGFILTDDEIGFFDLFVISVPFSQAFKPSNS